MNVELTAVVGLTLLLLLYNHDTVAKLWQKLMWYIHIASGKQLFDCVMMYAPGENVEALLFSNDTKYADKVMKILEKKEVE